MELISLLKDELTENPDSKKTKRVQKIWVLFRKKKKEKNPKEMW